MITFLLSCLNGLLGILVRTRCKIEVDPSSQVKWLALLNVKGGHIQIGRSSIVHCGMSFDNPKGKITIGDRCFIGASHLVCHTGISMGDDVVISWGVTIVDHDSHSLEWKHRKADVLDWAQGRKNWDVVSVRPVRIEDKVWIGFDACILKGVTLGEGAVVGAHSVVTRDVPPFTVVAGNPARVVRHLEAENSSQ